MIRSIPLLVLVFVLSSCSSNAGGKPPVPAPKPAMVKTQERPPLPAMDSLFQEAEKAVSQGKLAEAVTLYEQAVAFSPDEPRTYQRLGQVYLALRMPERAEEFYVKAIEKGLNDADVHFEFGYIEETLGMMTQALVQYRQADALGKNTPALFYNIGNVYARQNRNQDAIGAYKKAVALDPKHMDAFVNLSSVSFYEAKYADAQIYLDKARKLGYKAPEEYIKVLAEKAAVK